MSQKINNRHYQFDAWLRKANKCRSFMSGEEVVKDEKTKFLPRLSGQTTTEYNAMLDRTLFYGASKRTKMALSGAVNRKHPVVTMDSQYEDYLKDIALQEIPFNVFAKQATDEVLTTGRFVVCIDWDEGLQRPYARSYPGESLINFRYANYYGRQILSLVVLEETKEIESDADPFTIELLTCYRVKALIDGVYTEQVWVAKDKKANDFVLVEEYVPTRNGKALDFIPVVVLNTSQLGCEFEESMLNDLVSVNIQHYITSADIGTVLHFSALPTLTITGIDGRTLDDGDPIRLGSTNSIILPPGASASVLEFSGSSASAIRQHLADLEHRMAVLGARLLDPSNVSPATATAEIVKAASETTALRSLAQTLDAGLSRVLSTMIWWSGNDNPEVEVALNKDFLSSRMAPSELTAMTDAYLKGGLSAEAYMHQLHLGEMLPPNVDKDAEIKRLNDRPVDTDGMRMRTERNTGPEVTNG